MTRALRYKTNKVRAVASRVGDAAVTIGSLSEGVHVTGVTAGQFSSIDAAEHMVDEIGPCFVCVSTWTTGIYDVHRAANLAANDRVLGWRFLLDRGTFEKSPKFAGPLIEALGREAFRCTAVHAKVTVLVDSDWRGLAVMRSSMNLNKNLRTEQFDISIGGPVSEFYANWFETIWDEAGVGGANGEVMDRIFKRFLLRRKSEHDSDCLSGLVLGELGDA